ncbi:hypothetical protein [Nonomuraea rhodomycinica]|uniref:Uncharacterized protein n=1 Tax=Nonomuraea rhodomycinica TaxID=1712872 RepID=A0A7Y6IXG3_9ACTN|nr:hypothetical protein [Nonomuraea rhodomycinica]NUW45861.1 hypothetical protein [Nonomuraea rhodomycinica]
MLSRVPASHKVVLGVCGLLGVLYLARWLSGAEVYVRGPFFWLLLAVKVTAVALAIGASFEGIRRSRRGEHPEPISGEAVDDSHRRQLQGSVGIGFVAFPLLSSIFYMFAATDGGYPHTAGPLDLAAYASTGVMFVALIAMLTWMWKMGMR